MRKLGAALSAAMLLCLTFTQAEAQSFDSRYQQAFAARVGNPGDISALSAFVRLAVRAGQYDQALSTIEQHLITYPRDARAHLIAARLYHHVGSRELAARHLEYAIDIGTLGAGDHRAAKRLLTRVNQALSGISGFLDVTVGVRGEFINFSPNPFWTDRRDYNPFIQASGQLRFDLETANNNALILFGEVGTTRRFGDYNFDGIGGIYTAPHGRAGITLDVGLPTELIPTLRGQLTAYGSYETFDAGLFRRAYGATARLTAAPTANTFVYAEAGYAWLGNSSGGLLEDDRITFETGATWRFAQSHSIGLSGRGYVDRNRGFGKVGHVYEGELGYAGQVLAFENGIIWSQQAGIALGDIQRPDTILGPAFPIFGDYWRAYWAHTIQIDDRSRFDFDLSFRDTRYSNLPIRDQSRFDASISYTISLY